MDAAKLVELIDIYKQTKEMTPYGEVRDKYVEKRCSTRAFVKFNSENKVTQEGEVIFTTNRTFIVRNYVPVDEYDEIEWNGKRYSIVSINRNKYYNNIEIYTEEKNV